MSLLLLFAQNQVGLDGVPLPNDLIWVDEFDWNPIKQNQTRSLSGALIIETGIKKGGRQITLQGGKNYGLATREKVKVLQTKLSKSNMSLTLYDGQAFIVNLKQIEAKPLIDYSTPLDSDLYTLQLKMVTTR